MKGLHREAFFTFPTIVALAEGVRLLESPIRRPEWNA